MREMGRVGVYSQEIGFKSQDVIAASCLSNSDANPSRCVSGPTLFEDKPSPRGTRGTGFLIERD
jgi:hypothetical protein